MRRLSEEVCCVLMCRSVLLHKIHVCGPQLYIPESEFTTKCSNQTTGG